MRGDPSVDFARLRLAARSRVAELQHVLMNFARLRLAARSAFGAACGLIQAIALPRRQRSVAGFTLLEVMAAVALLGTVYTVLGSAGIQGLQHEGEARRRIEASLIADALLADLEASADAGQLPQPGKEERREGDFAVEIEIAPTDLPVPDDPNPLPAPAIGGAQPSGLGGKTSGLPPALSASLLRGDGRAPSPLRRITLRVGWSEGSGERSVVRTTYALDAQAAQGALDALDAAASAAAAAAAPAGPANPQAPQTIPPTTARPPVR